jgi:cell fate regulator YaaT (PSP1 superfamily)
MDERKAGNEPLMERVYLVRYGLARSMGRFRAASGALEPGRTVVIRTHRGTELGEILAESPPTPSTGAEPAPILRLATPEDLERARKVANDRSAHFEVCRAAFEDGAWPLELIDAEPLLDEGRTVLHYLGPHRLDASGLIAAFRDRCGLHVVLEPVGRDISEPEPEPEEESQGCGSCGSHEGGCGSGGCGTACAVKSLVAARRRVAVDA